MRKIFLFLLVFLCCSSLYAGQINEIVIFGDSLSDDGNLHQKLKIIPKSPPYYKGRFSNGETWAEHVGNYYYKKYFMDYSNYAYGGATAILHKLRTDKFIAPMLLQAELDAYFLRSPRQDKSQSVYALWIGANDYLYETESDLDGLTSDVVNKIAESATTILDKGAHGIVILNLPDLSSTPYARNHNTVERLATITHMHNAKLEAAVKNLSAKYPNKVVYMDIYGLFIDLLTNTEKYNQRYGVHITDTTQSCWLGTVLGLTAIPGAGQETAATIINSPVLKQSYLLGKRFEDGDKPCDNADQHLFWDDLHPTAVVHQLLGKIIVENLEANKLV